MNKYDYSKLKGLMREKGYTQETLADRAKISVCSMNLTLNNNRSFKQDEIVRICNALDICPERIPEYFFYHVSLEN